MSIVKCTHCHLEFDEKVMIKESNNPELNFCCNGCQGVYHLLQSDGLDGFYDKLGNNTLSAPIEHNDDLNRFNLRTFKKQYVKTTDDGFSKIHLIMEGIHCAACVWLNEKILYQTDGIVDVSINFSNYKATIIWDNDVVQLSQIIEKIQSIGYNAYPYDRTISEQKATKENQSYFIKMMVAVFASLNIMMLSIAKYTGFFSGMDSDILHIVHIGEFILTTPVLFYSGSIFYKGAYFGLKNRIINMDFLVISGASLVYIYSTFILFGMSGNSYYDSATMIITFVLVGKYLEVKGKKNAVDTLDTIKSQLPTEATIIKNNIKKVVSLEEINEGDIIEIKVGEKTSVDGILISGSTSFDESSISGESLLVSKNIDDKIISGTINLDSVIRYKATTDYEHSTLNNIITIIEDSLNSKSDIENSANILSKYFSVTILLVSIFSFIGWYLYNNDFENSLVIAISVIIIACPCALALATPIASLIGISQLAKEGILFKEAKYIETFAKATTLVLDKTGTITSGKLSVIEENWTSINETNINLLYSLVDSSTHPISVAIKNYIKNNYDNLSQLSLENIQQIPAIGMEATYNNKKIFGGKIDNNIEYQNSVYHFAIDGITIATFLLEDEIKEDAKEIISYLQNENIKVVMCTGDNDAVASKISKQIGLKEFKSNMNPIQKADFISSLQKNGEIVIMAGDGVNDAPSLSRASIAIAMGNGADISIAVSDVVLLNNSLKSLKYSFLISKRTYKFIKQNLFISLLYNIITIPLALMGYVIPLIAALSMSLSSLLVVGNSLRIKGK